MLMYKKLAILLSYLRAIIAVPLFWAVLVLGGCAATSQQDNTHEYLDQSTGITVTALAHPIIFFHEQPAVAANARDYLYVGPVEMNQMGKRAYYLWFGQWSSIDRALAGEKNDIEIKEIVLLLDGMPMELNDTLAPYDKSRIIKPPYRTPVTSLRDSYIRVSRDQLNKIGTADHVSVRIGQGNNADTYQLWSGNLKAFGAITNNVATARPQLVDMSD